MIILTHLPIGGPVLHIKEQIQIIKNHLNSINFVQIVVKMDIPYLDVLKDRQINTANLMKKLDRITQTTVNNNLLKNYFVTT